MHTLVNLHAFRIQSPDSFIHGLTRGVLPIRSRATMALANKMTRIGWAILRHETVYQPA